MQRFFAGVAIGAVLLGALWLASEPEPMHEYAGAARVIDGDTLAIGGQSIRLTGLDAPELAQSCTGADGTGWPCGAAARQRLLAVIGGEEVRCRGRGHDRYGRALTVCAAAGSDLGAALVTAGLAVSDGGYARAESGAKRARLGIWAGPFVRPALWRAQHGSGHERDGGPFPGLFN